MKNILLLILAFIPLQIEAAWRAPITNFSAESSIGGRQNWGIVQNQNGWIYVANNGGLLEYNGYDWCLRPMNNLSAVTSVACAENGDIYIGGRGEIGRFSPDEMGRLQYTNFVEIMPEEMRLFNEVWNISATKDHVYFQLRRSVYVLDHHDEFRAANSSSLILASCIINNSFYYSNSDGIYVMGDSEPIKINLLGSLPLKDVCSMSPYDGNKILIATMSNGLYIYDQGEVSKFRTDGDNLLSQNRIYSLAVGRTHIACGTVKGGVITLTLDGQDAEQNDLNSGLSNNTVLSVMFDSHDNLWCGLDNGIDYLMLSSPIRYAEINREYRFSGYCTLQDGDYIYMGTNQGLIRVDNSDSSIHPLQTASRSEIVENGDGQVWNLQKFNDRLYCCHNRGLFLIDNSSRSSALRPIYTDDGVWNIIPIDDKRFLICTYEGIIRVDIVGRNSYQFHRVEGYDGSVRDMKFSDPLRLGFFISERGLERVQFDASFESLKNHVLIGSTAFDIKLLRIGSQNLAYTPTEVYLFNDDGTIELTHKYDHLFDMGEIYSTISVDQGANIWYVSGDRLLCRRYEAERNSFEEQSHLIFNKRNFFVNGFTQITPFDDRYYLVNGVDGFSLVDSKWRSDDDELISPYIIGLYDTNNRDSLIISSAYGVKADRIRLKHSSNSIRIIFGSSTIQGQGVQYSYKLEGNDREWSEWSSPNQSSSLGIHNQKEYTNLFEGDYTFSLRLLDAEGNIEESSLDITILPPWQRSIIMYILYFIIFVTLVLYSINRINSYYTDRRRLVELQSERQIEQQKRQYESLAMTQENKIIKLKNEKLESEVVAKSAELSNLMLNKLEKNDIILGVKTDLEKIKNEVLTKQYDNIMRRITTMDRHLDDRLIDNVDWSIFEDNFNVTNNNFIKKIGERYSWMSVSERKLCIYIKMGLQNKEIAPLLNLSVRGVEMLRYRIRKKMELDRNENLYEFFQKL